MAKPETEDLELKGLKLALIDLTTPYIEIDKKKIAYLSMYENELEDLVGKPPEEQKKALEVIAKKAIVSYQRENGGKRT